jgi:hypothetical protein
MKTDSQICQIIQQIVEKPAIYFGNRDGYVRDVEALDIGYAMGTESNCLIPVKFKEFIIESLAPNNPRGDTWFTLIRKNAIGEKAEWELFERLWKDYDK